MDLGISFCLDLYFCRYWRISSELSGPQHLVCTFSCYSVWVWIHGGIVQVQPLWLLVSIWNTIHCSAHQPPSCPPTVPLVPLFMWPPWPVLCDSIVRRPHAQVAMAMTLEALVRHTHRPQTHSLTHCGKGKRSIFYYTEGGNGGERRIALQWAHCRHKGN